MMKLRRFYFSLDLKRKIKAKPYSGKLVLRMPSELHGRVAAAASAAGTTINDFINNAVSNEVAHVFG